MPVLDPARQICESSDSVCSGLCVAQIMSGFERADMNTAAPDQIEILPTKRSTSKRRLKTLLFIGALVFACIYGFKYFWLEHPVGTGPAGPPVPRDAFQSVWSDRDVLLIGLGDSVTDGLGSQPGSKSYLRFFSAISTIQQTVSAMQYCRGCPAGQTHCGFTTTITRSSRTFASSASMFT